jgi:hypothetical protein
MSLGPAREPREPNARRYKDLWPPHRVDSCSRHRSRGGALARHARAALTPHPAAVSVVVRLFCLAGGLAVVRRQRSGTQLLTGLPHASPTTT